VIEPAIATPGFAGTRNPGELIMNRIQKAATAFVSLTITFVGATLATAPLALTDIRPAVLRYGISSVAQSPAAPLGSPGLRQG
jgi:hypothetical protein